MSQTEYKFTKNVELSNSRFSKHFGMIMNKFCQNNIKLKDKFKEEFGYSQPRSNIDVINAKVSLHERRHNMIFDKIKSLPDIKYLVDLCTSEGKLVEKISKEYPDLRILGLEKDFYKIKKIKQSENVRVIESNILYPKITITDCLPDLLTCVEAIEHFEYEDRISILQLIKKVFVPKYLYLTTPNIEFNKFYDMKDGKLRRNDHRIEYTRDQFEAEVVRNLSESYHIEHLDLIESSDEYENLQPSFCIFCTHKSISTKYITISKPYPKKDNEVEERVFSMEVDPTEWTPERILDWSLDTTDYRHARNRKTKNERCIDFKALKALTKMQGNIYLPVSDYFISEKEINKGYTNHAFIRNSRNVFYMAPTVSPVESLKEYMIPTDKLDYHRSLYGKFDSYIEHPLGAIKYYKDRGVTQLIQQTKYMGSRTQILWFKDFNAAQEKGMDSTLVINSRGGFEFFKNQDEQHIKLDLHSEISKNISKLEKEVGFEISFIILDAELLPWSYASKTMLNEQFYSAIESQYLSNLYCGDDTDYVETALNTLNQFTMETDIEIRPFHVLAIGTKSKRSLIHGYTESNLKMMRYIEIITEDCKILKPCEYKIVSDDYDRTYTTSEWLSRCGSASDETLQFADNSDLPLLEGFVYKPLNNFSSQLPSGYYIQPALKVRGYKYLNLTYGLPLYKNQEYFNNITNRNVAKKRGSAIQEFECSKHILDAFLNNRHELRLKYLAGFLGMGSAGVVDRTL